MPQAPVWARQPRIQPNYNLRKFKTFPRNMANRMRDVLLHGNATEEHKLEAKTRQLSSQRASILRSGHLHRQAFIVRQIMQEMQLEAIGAKTTSLLPRHLVDEHRHLAMFHNFFYMGGKDLPIHHRLDRFFLKSLQNAQINREIVRSTYTVPSQKRDDNKTRRVVTSNGYDESDALATTSVASDAQPSAVLGSLTSDSLPTAITTSVTTDVQLQPAPVTDTTAAASPTGADQHASTVTATGHTPAARSVTKSVTLARHPAGVTRSVTFDSLPAVAEKSTEPRPAHKQAAGGRGTEPLPSILERPKHSAAKRRPENTKCSRTQPLLHDDGGETSTAAREPANALRGKATRDDLRFSRLEKLLSSSQSMVSFQKKTSLEQDALGKTQSLERMMLPGSTKRYSNAVKSAVNDKEHL